MPFLCLQVAKGRAANLEELSRNTAAAWALQGGMGCLEPAGRLAAELLPAVRALAAGGHHPGLQSLQPAAWARYWQGQLYQEHDGGGGDSWQQAQEDAAAGAPPPADDAIEESEDEDDW